MEMNSDRNTMFSGLRMESIEEQVTLLWCHKTLLNEACVDQ